MEQYRGHPTLRPHGGSRDLCDTSAPSDWLLDRATRLAAFEGDASVDFEHIVTVNSTQLYGVICRPARGAGTQVPRSSLPGQPQGFSTVLVYFGFIAIVHFKAFYILILQTPSQVVLIIIVAVTARPAYVRFVRLSCTADSLLTGDNRSAITSPSAGHNQLDVAKHYLSC